MSARIRTSSLWNSARNFYFIIDLTSNRITIPYAVLQLSGYGVVNELNMPWRGVKLEPSTFDARVWTKTADGSDHHRFVSCVKHRRINNDDLL